MIPFDHLVGDVLQHARQTPDRECCGIIVMCNGVPAYRPCRNVEHAALEFKIHPADYIRCKAEGIIGIAHSHLFESAEPSMADLKGCGDSGVPWLIVAVKNGVYKVVQPAAYNAPLVGRPYAPPMFDCYTLFKDWYATRGIQLVDFERDEDFWQHGNDMLSPANFEKAGFSVVPKTELREGDGLVFKAKDQDLCAHLAVYLGNEVMLHHRRGRLSCREPYRGIWVDSTHYVIRHGKYAD